MQSMLSQDTHQPYLLLRATPLNHDLAWQHADVINKAGTPPITLTAPASRAAAHFPQADIVNASPHKPQHLDHTGTTNTVQHLDHTTHLQTTAALTARGGRVHRCPE